jgi:putative redox protein
MTDWMDRATAVWSGEGVGFDATTASGHLILTDGNAEHGGREYGARPMELVLVGLAGCTGVDVISMLKKMRQDVTGYEVRVRDRRADEHPRRFTEIEVLHVVRGRNLDAAAVQRAVTLSAEKYCPASAALAAGCPVRHTAQVIPEP